jgi:hypothetical protein
MGEAWHGGPQQQHLLAQDGGTGWAIIRHRVWRPGSTHRPPIVAGSVASSSEVRKRIAQTRFRFFARGLEGFAPLAERSGAIAESRIVNSVDRGGAAP